MGAVLQRAALSPNIKDRLDFSCAVFDAQGQLCAQAAHIPVHLGSMAYAMAGIIKQIKWCENDMVIVNDPFLGGTHLPDVTLIAPVFSANQLIAFIANRAHHADIGASTPGSMPLSQRLDEEGIIIPPTHLLHGNQLDEALLESLTSATNNTEQAHGDFSAQISANRIGIQRLDHLMKGMGTQNFVSGLMQLDNYAARMAQHTLTQIPCGIYAFSDAMDDDGMGNTNLLIKAKINVTQDKIKIDFDGTAPQTKGNINCPLSVTAAAVYYVFRCLMPHHIPACAGSFRSIEIQAPQGCLINAKRPAAVAAGNVETSSRIVDVIMGCLVQAMPDKMAAASHGSMNNVAMGIQESETGFTPWSYYETLGGGMGASSTTPGLSAVQTHMTNTLNTPVESLEMHYPLRINRYEIRCNSGGQGQHQGGDGLIREYEFLQAATVTLLTERRNQQPWGQRGGANGATGTNTLDGEKLSAKCCFKAKVGQRLTIETPGGGGWGDNTR